jgi:hypothetical protein
MHQHFRALDVPQEAVAEAMTFMRAFDQSWDIGHHEAAIAAQRHHAEVGRQRRERVVGDLRARRRDARDEGGLARVGETHEPDVGQQLQLEMQRLHLARFPGFGPPRCAIRGRHELRVAAAATPPFGDEHALSVVREIGDQARAVSVLLEHERTDRHGDLEVRRRVTGAVAALSVASAPGFEFGVVAKIDQGVLGGNRGDVDRAARAAVAAVGPAARDVFLSTKTEATVAARTGFDVDVDFVDEHDRNQESGIRNQGLGLGLVRPVAADS